MAGSKHKPNRRTTTRRNSMPGWVWLLGGLSLGLLVALAVHWYDRNSLGNKTQAAATPAPAKSAANQAKKPTPAKEAASTKQRFDFYAILPEMEVVVPESEMRGNARKPGASDKPSTYILQAGSFRTHEDADQLKAKLALLGVESRIEAVTGSNKETWHRVRTVPYQDMRQLNKIRTRLLNNNINSVLLKVKE